jgi:glycosyltransferase involved in cell wall biosynthesis
MKITLVLPTPSEAPTGGAKVVYEYANGLVQRGHEVTVIHTLHHKYAQKSHLHQYAIYLGKLAGLRGGYGPKRWMQVDPRVKVKLVRDLSAEHIPPGDIIIATAWRTAEAVLNFPADKGRKYYFIQDYEYFMTAAPDIRARMAATYSAAFQNIVISPACAEIVETSGGTVYCQVPNGLDHDVYRLTVPINSPKRQLIGFPTRSEPFKRTQDAIEALSLFREKSKGDFEYWSFGAKKPQGFPDWIKFHERPSDEELVQLYNLSTIFVVPSEYEGWGLPGSEAMCCGAALVSTDNGGVRAYAQDKFTALISPTLNIKALVTNLLKLTDEPQVRLNLAQAGHDSIQKFTWGNSVSRFENALYGKTDDGFK